MHTHNTLCLRAPVSYLANDIKAVQLAEQLHECALDLTVCAGALTEAPTTNGIDLIHEDHTRLLNVKE